MALGCCLCVGQQWAAMSTVGVTSRGFSTLLPIQPPQRLANLYAVRQLQCSIEVLPVEVFEATSDAHLKAACDLRVCTFNDFPRTHRILEHCQYLSERELKVLKDKVMGKSPSFGKVTCIIAAVPLRNASYEQNLISLYKENGVHGGIFDKHLIVGSLDLNKTPILPDEICGRLPKVIIFLVWHGNKSKKAYINERLKASRKPR
ncbi:hypothetical protein KP509_1Z272800 [Ceratopteris richardii]|nr:hypothetical protein KP509_1Z272800 [Ceratopteris richardii]